MPWAGIGRAVGALNLHSLTPICDSDWQFLLCAWEAGKRVASPGACPFTGPVILLPIADRELRVAARRKSTFWIRISAAVIAVLIGSAFLLLVSIGGSTFSQVNFGRGLFAVLTWLSLAAASSAGIFLTSDCLSEEKREGTMGLLFLTSLRGYDVVLGKLLATSLQSFYALLAVLPIVAMTLLLGGVAVGEFWRTAIALVNALFISLSAGMLVSALSRDFQKAMGTTVVLLLAVGGAGPALDAFCSKPGPFVATASFSSPIYLFLTADEGSKPALYWTAFWVNQCVGWLFLGLSCGLLPRVWQMEARKVSRGARRATRWMGIGGNGESKSRARLLDLHPMVWLVTRERWQGRLLWSFALLMLAGLAGLTLASNDGFWFLWSAVTGFFVLFVYLLVAAESSKFFVEARRSGLLELLLASPLSAAQIIQGRWRGLVRQFALPLIVCLMVQWVGSALAQQITSQRMAVAMSAANTASQRAIAAAATNAAAGGTNAGVAISGTVAFPTATISWPGLGASVWMGLLALVTTAGNLAAMSWFGMWKGLNSVRNSVAALQTMIFAQIIPWFVVSFAAGLIVPLVTFRGFARAGGSMEWMNWLPVLMASLSAILFLIKNFAFIRWSRRKLSMEFRERAGRSLGESNNAAPPIIRAA